MVPAVKWPGSLRPIAVILLTVTLLACVAGLAHAGMVKVWGQDCSGPGCEQAITCGRPDQVIAAPKQYADPLAMVVSAVIDVSPPQNQTMPVTPTRAEPNSRSVCPLASRSPPAA